VELLDIGAGAVEAAFIPHLVAGFFVSLISGYFALKYLIVLFKSKGIHYFAYYCWSIGIFGLIYFT
jgi:undecaprenyl-diphosphatase